jgi:hypothetical protein
MKYIKGGLLFYINLYISKMKINRLEVYNKCNGHCAYCGKDITLKQMQVDHKEPIFRNYTDDELKRYINNVVNVGFSIDELKDIEFMRGMTNVELNTRSFLNYISDKIEKINTISV